MVVTKTGKSSSQNNDPTSSSRQNPSSSTSATEGRAAAKASLDRTRTLAAVGRRAPKTKKNASAKSSSGATSTSIQSAKFHTAERQLEALRSGSPSDQPSTKATSFLEEGEVEGNGGGDGNKEVDAMTGEGHDATPGGTAPDTEDRIGMDEAGSAAVTDGQGKTPKKKNQKQRKTKVARRTQQASMARWKKKEDSDNEPEDGFVDVEIGGDEERVEGEGKGRYQAHFETETETECSSQSDNEDPSPPKPSSSSLIPTANNIGAAPGEDDLIPPDLLGPTSIGSKTIKRKAVSVEQPELGIGSVVMVGPGGSLTFPKWVLRRVDTDEGEGSDGEEREWEEERAVEALLPGLRDLAGEGNAGPVDAVGMDIDPAGIPLASSGYVASSVPPPPSSASAPHIANHTETITADQPPSSTSTARQPTPKQPKSKLRLRWIKLGKPHQIYRITKIVGKGRARVYEGKPIKRVKVRVDGIGTDATGQGRLFETDANPGKAPDDEHVWKWADVKGEMSIALKIWFKGKGKDELKPEYRLNGTVWEDLAGKNSFGLLLPALARGQIALFNTGNDGLGTWEIGGWSAILYPLHTLFLSILDDPSSDSSDPRIRALWKEAILTVSEFNKLYGAHRDWKADDTVIVETGDGSEKASLMNIAAARKKGDSCEGIKPCGTYDLVSPSMGARLIEAWMKKERARAIAQGISSEEWDLIRGGVIDNMPGDADEDIDQWSIGIQLLTYLNAGFVADSYPIRQRLAAFKAAVFAPVIDLKAVRDARDAVGECFYRISYLQPYIGNIPEEYVELVRGCLKPSSFTKGFAPVAPSDQRTTPVAALYNPLLEPISSEYENAAWAQHPLPAMDASDDDDEDFLPDGVTAADGKGHLLLQDDRSYHCELDTRYDGESILYPTVDKKGRAGLHISRLLYKCPMECCRERAAMRMPYFRDHFDGSRPRACCPWLKAKPEYYNKQLPVKAEMKVRAV